MNSYNIRITDPFHLEYIEGARTLALELNLQKRPVILFMQTIRQWLPPHEHEAIEAYEREEILWRIHDYLKKEHKADIIVDELAASFQNLDPKAQVSLLLTLADQAAATLPEGPDKEGAAALLAACRRWDTEPAGYADKLMLVAEGDEDMELPVQGAYVNMGEKLVTWGCIGTAVFFTAYRIYQKEGNTVCSQSLELFGCPDLYDPLTECCAALRKRCTITFSELHTLTMEAILSAPAGSLTPPQGEVVVRRPPADRPAAEAPSQRCEQDTVAEETPFPAADAKTAAKPKKVPIPFGICLSLILVTLLASMLAQFNLLAFPYSRLVTLAMALITTLCGVLRGGGKRRWAAGVLVTLMLVAIYMATTFFDPRDRRAEYRSPMGATTIVVDYGLDGRPSVHRKENFLFMTPVPYDFGSGLLEETVNQVKWLSETRIRLYGEWTDVEWIIDVA